MSQQEYIDGLKAANFKMALRGLKDVADCLSKAHEPDLHAEIKRFTRRLITRAFKVLPNDLYTQIVKGG